MCEQIFTRQAEEFALDLMETLSGVLPTGDLGLTLQEVSHTKITPKAVLTTADTRGLELQVDGTTTLRLEIEFNLMLNPRDETLMIQKSRFSVVPDEHGTPFFSYDYDTGANSVPCAHLNVYAHRDDLINALIRGRKPAMKARRKRFIEEGQIPRVGNIHFPLGGRRFRPCLEDILQLIIDELNIDARDNYRTALKQGRHRYRERQLLAAARSVPEIAVQALEGLGYQVNPPATDKDSGAAVKWLEES